MIGLAEMAKSYLRQLAHSAAKTLTDKHQSGRKAKTMNKNDRA